MLRWTILYLLFFLPVSLFAQVFPKEGSCLNYTMIGFAFPAGQQAKVYKIEIADSNTADEVVFEKIMKVAATTGENRKIVEVSYFGTQYTWRYVYEGKGKKQIKSPLYHFSTAHIKGIDSMIRLRVLQPAGAMQDFFVIAEQSGVIFDSKGTPVWWVEENPFRSCCLYDTKFTRQGTITFFSKQRGYEINYNGDLLWVMPSCDPLCKKCPDPYHDEFVRLANGHYLVMGVEDLWCKLDTLKDSLSIAASQPPAKFRRNTKGLGNKNVGTFGTLLEFDEKGELVWSWKLSDYLLKNDFVNYYLSMKRPAFVAVNSDFYFDEKSSQVYVGIRDMNRIVKIEYPSGKILAVYGAAYGKKILGEETSLFCNQHSIGRTSGGDLLVYASNTCEPSALPAVKIFQEPTQTGDGLKNIWEYKCVPEKGVTADFGTGGNAVELPDHNIFVCMDSYNYSQLMVISRDKKILWSAIPEYYEPSEKKWQTRGLYRGNIISRKDLENMIWKAQDK
jgi:hypothetical protein